MGLVQGASHAGRASVARAADRGCMDGSSSTAHDEGRAQGWDSHGGLVSWALAGRRRQGTREWVLGWVPAGSVLV
jgi:hypothetical protein